jgi:hypothetical protein
MGNITVFFNYFQKISLPFQRNNLLVKIKLAKMSGRGRVFTPVFYINFTATHLYLKNGTIIYFL